jgi:hypothetical protein
LARAEEAGVDTTALRIEIYKTLDGCEDLALSYPEVHHSGPGAADLPKMPLIRVA